MPVDLGNSWLEWLFARIQLDEAASIIQFELAEH
jgi:hypothetical protein